MPTTHPRHQVTETDPVREALETARAAWPDETSPSKLLARLAVEGSNRLLENPTTRAELRRRTLAELHEAHPWPHGSDWLEAMREQDWAE